MSRRVSSAPSYTVRELLHGADVLATDGDPSLAIASVTFDSRSVTPGSLFVALRGSYADGHAYLRQAREAGAVAALVDATCPDHDLAGYGAVARVSDTRAALAIVADNFYHHPSAALRVVGVTGTDGKTTTSHMLTAVCRAAGLATGLVGTVEVRIADWVDRHDARQTTPESLLTQGYLARMRDARVDVAIVEATSHGLALHRLDRVAFDIGVVTNITHEHLDFHGTVENYRAAKGRLFAMVDAARSEGKLGVVVVNRDDPGARAIEPLAGDSRRLSYGTRGEAAIGASNVRNVRGGTAFTLRTPAGNADACVRLPGLYNVANALAAAGAGAALGVDVATIARGLGELSVVPGRMETVDMGQPFTVIVDYAHTPAALRSALGEARRITAGSVLTVFGSAGERDIEKRPAQGAIAVELADFAVFTSEDPRFEDPDAVIAAIARGAEEAGGQRGVHFVCIEDRRAAIVEALSRARPGDVVLLAGKGHEHSMIYGATRRPWDESLAAKQALRELGYGDSMTDRNSVL